MTKKKTPKPTPPVETFAIDKSETLAKADHEHPFVAHDASPVILDEDTKPMRIGSADAVLLVCPTCGTAKTENRCAVCGHQEHDT